MIDLFVLRMNLTGPRPVIITLIAGCLGLCIPYLCYNQMPYCSLALLTLSGFLDTLDGALARAQGKQSELGAVLDIFIDRVVESATVFGIYLVDPTTLGSYCILMLISMLLCITSFLVVGIFNENEGDKSFHYSPGLMERTEAFCFFAAMILFPYFFNLLAFAFTSLVLLTAFIRIYEFAILSSRQEKALSGSA